jgi:hypothetical protein
MRGRWRTLIGRAAAATVVAWVIATVPLPRVGPETWFAYVQVPLAIFLLICYVGKLVIDTFFYNHYQP